MIGRTKALLKADRSRFEKLKLLPCIACLIEEAPIPCGPTEAHHLLSGGRRRGHKFSIPLGPWHHRGVLNYGYSATRMTTIFGPSLALGSKAFHAHFGSDNELLENTNYLLDKRYSE